MIVGILGLHLAYTPVHDTPLHEELTVLDIEIAPLQPRDFADAALRHVNLRMTLDLYAQAVSSNRPLETYASGDAYAGESNRFSTLGKGSSRSCHQFSHSDGFMVGTAGFEPTTSTV